jgi:hypothetical protein
MTVISVHRNFTGLKRVFQFYLTFGSAMRYTIIYSFRFPALFDLKLLLILKIEPGLTSDLLHL